MTVTDTNSMKYEIIEIEPPGSDGKIGEWPLGYKTRRRIGEMADLITAWNYCMNRRAHEPKLSNRLYVVAVSIS
jgi:hypothetical protein